MYVCSIILPQYHFKKALESFKDNEFANIRKEMRFIRDQITDASLCVLLIF